MSISKSRLLKSTLIGVSTLLLGTLIAYKLLAPSQDGSVTQSWSTSNNQSTKVIDHQLWQAVLDDYLVFDENLEINTFDYQGLADDGTDSLDKYISYLSQLNPREFNSAEQFAYWVNLYNALTIQVVVRNYPVSSIKEIGSSPLPTGPWNDEVVEITGEALSLNHIEHSILRPVWQDYRIHFAVNCASIGCPDLQEKAFTKNNTENLLNKAAQSFLTHERGLTLQNGTLTLSSIFDWYSEDFGANKAEVLNTLSVHLPSKLAGQLKDYSGPVEYQYNWQLNEFNEP